MSVTTRVARFRVFALSGIALACLSTASHRVFGQDNGRGKPCGIGTIEGDWAVTVSGTRVAGAAGPETFIGLALRTYDGRGGFVEAARSHGTATGATAPRINGTYTVNPDCTGTAQFFPPGSPVSVESAFIVIDRLDEIDEIVMTPQPNLVSAVQRRLR